MKKIMVMLLSVSVVGAACADIYTAIGCGFGISGNGANGGLVGTDVGTKVLLQLIDGGGDGLDYYAPGQVLFDGLGNAIASGNDIILGTLVSTVTAGYGTDYSDWAATISGTITGAWTSDAYFRVSGVNAGDWVYESGVIAFDDIDTSDSKAVPQGVFFDEGGAGGSADGLVVVAIPEPATIGLMGVAGVGLFLARKKTKARC